jgi:hypothetical protein
MGRALQLIIFVWDVILMSVMWYLPEDDSGSLV